MSKYVFQLWVTVEAKDLTEATNQAHHYAESLEADPYIDNVLIGDEYEKVINEFGDTIPAED